MMQQDVPLPDRSENVGFAVQAIRFSRHERRIFELGDLDLVDQRGETHDVDRTVAAVKVIVGQLELRE